METKYLDRFLRLAPGQLPLRGNRLLVELLPKEEVLTAGGLVIATNLNDHRSTTKENQADLAVVLAAGPGYYSDDTGEDVALDVKPGNVVMLTRYGIRAFSSFPGVLDFTQDTIAMCRDSDIHAAWESIEAYEQYRAALGRP